MPPIIANFKDGQGHKYYLYPVPEFCLKNAHMQNESSKFYYFVMNNVFFKICQMSRSKSLQQQKDLITRNIHVKYENSETH